MSLTDSSVTSAATALYDDLSSNGCQAVSNSNVLAFQQAFNDAGGSPPLATDGLYGANTSGALQQVFGANPGSTLGSYTAPSGCVAQGGANGTTAVTIPVTDNVNFGYWPWVLGGAVLVAGSYAAYAYSKKHHKRGKRRR